MHPDRHGRTRRTDGDRRRRPADGFRARDPRRFVDLAEEAIRTLPVRLLREIADARLMVEDVPREEDDGVLPDEPPLGRLELGSPRVLVLYRRPIELRAGSRGELGDVLRDAVAQAIGRGLGWPEQAWDWENPD